MRAPTSTRGILVAALAALISGLGILTLIVGLTAPIGLRQVGPGRLPSSCSAPGS